MAVIKSTTQTDLVRLLDLFPRKVLKNSWPEEKGNKKEVCVAIAAKCKPSEIVQFVEKHFTGCKQHVYLHTHGSKDRKLPNPKGTDGEKVLEIKDRTKLRGLYLFWCEYTVILTDPLGEEKIRFLWPVLLDFEKDHLIIRFVVLEKDLSAYFEGRSVSTARKAVDEEDIVGWLLESAQGAVPMDFHKGLKAIWKQGFVDCSRAQFKKPHSTASETMDENLGIKENNDDLYKILLQSTILNGVFASTAPKESTVFVAKPGEGYLSFLRYSDENGGSDHVIREIIGHN